VFISAIWSHRGCLRPVSAVEPCRVQRSMTAAQQRQQFSLRVTGSQRVLGLQRGDRGVPTLFAGLSKYIAT
jgi:hypothetical protein